MPKVQTNEKAFMTKLQALYDIEKAIEKALPKMQAAAVDRDLKAGFKMHLAETKMQSKRLEQAFRIMGMKPKKLKCEGIRGIIEDGSWVMKEVDAPANVADAMLASSARYVEHYEMAGYMSAIMEAKMLGQKDIVALLQETLKEEQAADVKLAVAAEMNLEMESQ